MRHCLVLLLLCGLSTPACAGVNAQSAGVTGIDPTVPSNDVQQQSAGFVAQNQQLQNAGAGQATVIPPLAGTAAANAAANAAHESSQAAAAHEAAAKAAAEQKAPPPPPAPPPVYESRMRPVERSAAVAEAVVPAAPQKTPAAASAAPHVEKPALAKSANATLPAQAPVTHPAAPTVPQAPAEPEAAPDPGGGRGAAPEGYTFYGGMLIAGALLALALLTFLRLRRGETG